MMSARTGFLVWWGLPILCAGFGALIAAYAGEGGAFGRGPGQIGPLMVIGAYFALVGFLAVVFRARQSQMRFDERGRFDKPVEAALVALCAPILAAGIWFLSKTLAQTTAPTRIVTGELQSISRVGGLGRTYAIDLDRTAVPLLLECRFRPECGSAIPLNQLKPGQAMEIELLRSRVIGVKADGREVVSASTQKSWRMALTGAALVALLIYTLIFIGVSMALLFAPPEDDEEGLPA